MSDWENEIVIQITEEGAKNTETALKSISKEYKKLQDLAKQPLSPLGGAGAAADNNFAKAFSPQEFKKATTALSQFGIEYEKVSKTIMSPLSGGENRFADAFTKAGSGLDALKPKIDNVRSGFAEAATAVRIFRTLLIATGIEKFVANMVEMVDGLTNMQNKIRVVSDSLGASQIAFSQLVGIASQTRTGLDDVATVFSRTARSVQELGYRQSETLRFTKVLSQAVKVGGSTAVESSNALIQLSQGLASGTLKGDELRSVLEQLPVVSKLIADHFHIAVGQLRQFGLEGKLSAHEVFDAIIEGTDEMQRKFDQTIPTFAQGWEVFKTSVTAASAIFQPLVQEMAKGMINLADKIAAVPTVMDVLAKNFRTNSESMKESWFGRILDKLATGIGVGGVADAMLPPGLRAILRIIDRGGKKEFTPLANQVDKELQRKKEGEELMAMDDTSALDPRRNDRFKKFPQKAKKEGGLTFAQLVEKMRQEQEVASQTPFESGVTKEFFEKMGELKKSVREGLVTGANKPGKAREQLQELQEMIRLEHELAEAQKFVRYWDEKIEEAKKKRMQVSIDLGKKEEKARADNEKRIFSTNAAIMAGLDPFTQYNNKINDFNTFLNSHRNDKDIGTLTRKVSDEVLKMGYAYQKFAPIFEGVATSISDAAANSIVFGQNMHQALTQIAKDLTAKTMSALFQMGFNAIIGAPMPGINGGNPVTPAPPDIPNAASGGYFGRGFDSGGYTGNHSRGNVAGVVHGQEFVVNANATARNRAMLESMNAGKPVGSGGHNVVVNNYAGADVDTTTSDDGTLEIRIHKAISEKAPGIIAADMRNPNSRTSKALKGMYEMNRRS